MATVNSKSKNATTEFCLGASKVSLVSGTKKAAPKKTMRVSAIANGSFFLGKSSIWDNTSVLFWKRGDVAYRVNDSNKSVSYYDNIYDYEPVDVKITYTKK